MISRVGNDLPATLTVAKAPAQRLAKPDAEVLQTLAMARWQAREFVGAVAAARNALALDPTLAKAQLVIAWQLSRQGDWIGAEDAATLALSKDPKLAEAELIIARARLCKNDAVEAIESAKRVLAMDCGHDPTDLSPDLPCSPQDEDTKPESELRRRRRVEAGCLAAKASIAIGDPDRAAYYADMATKGLNPLRAIVVDDPQREVLIAERPGANAAVLVFSGLGNRLGLPLPVFDRYLAALGTSTFYIRDFDGLAALEGLRSLGNRYATTLATLYRMLIARGIKRVCTIGYSAGARAAVQYGVDLDADCIIGISGATGRAGFFADKLPHPKVVKRFARLSPDRLDLQRFLRHRVYRSRIEIIYNPEAQSEKTDALYLSRQPNVRVHPVGACRTRGSVVHQLAIEGELFKLLRDLLG
jgi:hypothetical protein